ncbi:Uncharacterized protein Fot_39153 [Forsythia ovata]|uniref:Uncharacterized protein n=1 Tax=Forsythia ovata TaxID=205694 RepID=A0ABD1S3T3_9LAMI
MTYHYPTQVLRNFNEIKLLRIELPSRELRIDALPASANNSGAQDAEELGFDRCRWAGSVVYERRAVGGAEGEASVRLLSFQKDSGSGPEYALMVCTTFGIAQWDGTERSDLSGHHA